MRKFRFTTRRLLLLTFVIASVLAALIGLHRAGQQAFGVGPIRDAEKWPAALKELLGDSPLLQNDVSVYALGNFIDHESVWVIKSGSPLIDRLRANNSLELVSGSHPKAKRLLASLPYGWPTIDTANCTWHATHGFGSQHIEGVNLFLVAKDETTGICFVLHEWIF